MSKIKHMEACLMEARGRLYRLNAGISLHYIALQKKLSHDEAIVMNIEIAEIIKLIDEVMKQ